MLIMTVLYHLSLQIQKRVKIAVKWPQRYGISATPLDFTFKCVNMHSLSGGYREVQMWPSSVSSFASIANHVANDYSVALRDLNERKMAIYGCHAIMMVYHYPAPV